MCPYYVQVQQSLEPSDLQRRSHFANWVLIKYDEQNEFSATISGLMKPSFPETGKSACMAHIIGMKEINTWLASPNIDKNGASVSGVGSLMVALLAQFSLIRR